ncbi:MAG: SusD/RagB family nutrient-binding outer membrane lipoprotein [Saprospiraceae bacterium]|nr:SusD/RagB family nutrient-binding outer membrane lipoprotein [Saprospiraceae bacterium]
MNIKNFIIIALFSFTWMSCGQDLADLNVDPNNSATARPQEVLTSGQVNYANVLDAIMNQNCALYAQYWAGGPGVAILDHERYFFEAADFNGTWSRSYRQSLSDLSFVIDNGNNSSKAAAQILSVQIYQQLVDVFGDIPYTEALRGSLDKGSILTPKYDTGKSIYDDLIKKVDAALVLLQSPEAMGTEDLIYGGNSANWIKYANSLKLKLLMRQAGKDATVADAVKAVVAKGNFIESASDMPVVTFSGTTGGWNPQFARNESGIKMFYVASNSYVKKMEELGDPRLEVLFNDAVNTGTIVGLDQGNINDLISPQKADFSYPSTVQYSASNPVVIMSNWEVYFLRAEAAMRFGTADDQVDMFNNAISSHFAYVGAGDASDYIESNAKLDPAAALDTKLNILSTQKWISMCGIQETEGWIETRRFDRPGNQVFTGSGTGIFRTPTRTVLGQGVFPSIFLVPQSELSFNPNAPRDRKITDKVFWDN